MYVGAIEALAHAVDAKDEVTHDHTRRVQDRAVQLARAMGVDDEGEIQAIKAASLLHDVGKLAIPEHILNKPGRLTPAEYDIMKRHAPIGADILAVIGFPFRGRADRPPSPRELGRHRLSGRTGRRGDSDRLADHRGRRLLRRADVRPAVPSEDGGSARRCQILSDRRGTMYDPHVVDTFFAIHGSGRSRWSRRRRHRVARHSALQTPLRTGEDQRELDLQTFFDFGRAVERAGVDVRAGRDAVWMHFKTRLPASTFVLYGYDQVDDSIVARLRSRRWTLDRCEPTRIPLGERLSGWVAATGQMVVNSDARLDLDERAREQFAVAQRAGGADRVERAVRRRPQLLLRASRTRSTMRTGSSWRRQARRWRGPRPRPSASCVGAASTAPQNSTRVSRN